jgi:hypothetical protein
MNDSKRKTTENNMTDDIKCFDDCPRAARAANLSRVAVERESLELDLTRLAQKRMIEKKTENTS